MVGGAVGGGELRREALVRAAFARVAEVGFEGLRLRQVAQDAGIDHSTLHHHFATKQALVEAVVGYTTAQFHVTAPVGVDPPEMLRGHLDALATLLATRPELLTVTAELDLRARRDGAVRRALGVHERGWREGLRAVFQQGGWATAVDADAAAELVIATVKGVRLAPDLSPAVFDQLLTLLTASATDPAGQAVADPGLSREVAAP